LIVVATCGTGTAVDPVAVAAVKDMFPEAPLIGTGDFNAAVLVAVSVLLCV
jgi:hypothetical protein